MVTMVQRDGHASNDDDAANGIQTHALWNMLHILSTDDTSHELSGWLNEDALQNIPPITITDDTSHLLSGWLNDDA